MLNARINKSRLLMPCKGISRQYTNLDGQEVILELSKEQAYEIPWRMGIRRWKI